MRSRLALIAGVAVALVVFALWWYSLPRPLFDEPWSTVAYARDGSLLGAQIAADGQWRFPGAKVPPRFEQALLAYEDKRFYEHSGVDSVAVARALYVDLRARRIVSGGSTLTMQTIRIARGREGSRLLNKPIEALLAWRLEAGFSKRQILSMYAEHAPFGGNVVGLEAASWRYFGRPADALSWAETCTLAVLPNSPTLVNPGRGRMQLKEKRDRLLRRLHERERLNDTDLKLALSEPLIDEPKPLPRLAPHLLATLKKRFPEQHRFTTTVDGDLQRRAVETVSQHARELYKQDIRNVAVLVIDNRSFEAIAYVGNSEWSVANDMGYAVDIVQRPRSTGSILKPFLYAAMLQSGDLAPRMLLADVPTQYAGYSPENYDRTYRGAVSADIALAQSLNVPAVRMLQEFGVPRFYDVLTQLGISTLTRAPDEYGLSLILGGAEGTLWDMTQSYANLTAIARDARPGKPARYRRAQFLTTAPSLNRTTTDIGPAAAWLTLRALGEVPRPGEESHWKNFSSRRAIAWKTGTSWGLRDAWSIGSTSQYTVGVWVGNASGAGRPGLIGGVAAAPLMFAVFQHLDVSPGIAPPRWAMKAIEVCKNDGYLANGSCATEREWIPRDSHFDKVTPHNVLVHLDSAILHRVDAACESISGMQHRAWFVLPPAQEYYYRRMHNDYRVLPPLREDCSATGTNANPIEFLYPGPAARIYLPLDFGSERGRVVFEAVHSDRDATLHWHVDDRFLGSTTLFHQQAVEIEPGMHLLTLVDQRGQRKTRRFEVIGEQ